MPRDRSETRRAVLAITGSAIGSVAGLAGAVSAEEKRVYAFGHPPEVHDSCDGDVIAYVNVDAEGTVLESCTAADGSRWHYVDWDDDDYTNGWGEENVDVVVY